MIYAKLNCLKKNCKTIQLNITNLFVIRKMSDV